MARNTINPFDIDPHVAEIYDRVEYGKEDVAFIQRLAAGLGSLKVLEPFCGTGRVVLPLAEAGHTVTGLDSSSAMLARARDKAAALPEDARRRLELVEMDVTCWADWPAGFDLVIVGGNGLYELATPEEQEGCIQAAAASLKPGGHLYLDSDHMEGVLDANWRLAGEVRGVMTGTCADGTYVENTFETTWYELAAPPGAVPPADLHHPAQRARPPERVHPAEAPRQPAGGADLDRGPRPGGRGPLRRPLRRPVRRSGGAHDLLGGEKQIGVDSRQFTRFGKLEQDYEALCPSITL